MIIQKMLLKNSILGLPTPVNISLFWNYGSLLGLCLGLQIVTGILLSLHYCSDVSLAFSSVDHIYRDVNLGWLMRVLHSNGASMFFFCLYLHIGRGIYYHSFMKYKVWFMGVLILFGIMGSAFLGYVLPWGQMSFWGATVITNLFSVIPFIGEEIVVWLWGGFSVGGSTLSRFFSFHFFLPLFSVVLVLLHMIFLHEEGSSNPLGMKSDYYKISFSPYFIFKDLFGLFVMLMFLGFLVFYNPWILGDVENFIPSNPMVTPVHIQPEWYFLFAYAILRSIPSKMGGVLALVLSILILLILPFVSWGGIISMTKFSPIIKLNFWILVSMVVLLTWIGACPAEGIYILVGQLLTFMYFCWFFIKGFIEMIWFSIIYSI